MMKDPKQTLLEMVHHIAISHQELISTLEQLLANVRNKIRWESILKDEISVKERFEKIYQDNMWGSRESRSGSGSTLTYTANLRSKIPGLIEKYKINSVFDAPCGDFNWMKILLPTLKVKYIGGDIVEDLIKSHKENYENKETTFVHINLIDEFFPKVDLMICRDCLFHLSYSDIQKVLENYISSDIQFLLTTTHINNQPNQNIRTGDFRFLNLFDSPYYFDANPLERIDDWIAPEPERQMCLWNRSQVITAVQKMKIHLES